MLEIIKEFISSVLPAVLAFGGVMLAQTKETKRKKMEIDADKEQDACIKYENRIKTLSDKVDGLVDAVTDLKASHQQTATMINVLSERVERHNNVIERTYKCEERLSVLENRESVSEHRLTDLEQK